MDLDLKKSKSKYIIDTEKDDPKLPALFVFCGARGTGKTHACVAMCRHFEKRGYITRTFLICPTKMSNDVFRNLKTLDEKNDVCDNENRCKLSLHNVVTEVKKEWKKYEEDRKYLKIYNKTIGSHIPPSLEESYILDSRNSCLPVKLQKPKHMLIVDDCQGTDMYSLARRDLMNHVTIKHRHIPMTICYLVQSWTGLPRPIRLNATHFIIYKTGDLKQLKQIYENFATYVTQEEFMQVYQYAVSKPHGFLFIDTDPKEESMRFRSGFNDFIEAK